GGRRRADPHRRRARPQDAPGHQARHLWRARRRPEQRRVLSSRRPGLRECVAVPRPHRPPRRRPGRPRAIRARRVDAAQEHTPRPEAPAPSRLFAFLCAALRLVALWTHEHRRGNWMTRRRRWLVTTQRSSQRLPARPRLFARTDSRPPPRHHNPRIDHPAVRSHPQVGADVRLVLYGTTIRRYLTCRGDRGPETTR